MRHTPNRVLRPRSHGETLVIPNLTAINETGEPVIDRKMGRFGSRTVLQESNSLFGTPAVNNSNLPPARIVQENAAKRAIL